MRQNLRGATISVGRRFTSTLNFGNNEILIYWTFGPNRVIINNHIYSSALQEANGYYVYSQNRGERAMASFKDELQNAMVSKNDLQNEIHAEIDRCVQIAINNAIEETCNSIKEKILQKAKKAEYEHISGKKRISGYSSMLFGYYREDLIEYREVFRRMDSNQLHDNYLRDYPHICIYYENESYSKSLVFYGKLVDTTRHDPLFGKTYYTYHVTDLAKNILRCVQSIAAADGISVSFSHILLDVAYHTLEIPDGGDDRQFTGYRGSNGHLMLKYSVEL